jgi:hypothetical protein
LKNEVVKKARWPLIQCPIDVDSPTYCSHCVFGTKIVSP